MTPPALSTPRARKFRSWLVFVVVVSCVTAAYYYADPARYRTPATNRTMSATAGIHLENVPFIAYSGGKQAWSLWAKSVDISHSAYSTASTIESAVLTDIRDGKLFEASGTDAILPFRTTVKPGQDTRAATKPKSLDTPLVRFHAHVGHYYVGSTHPLPAELVPNYTSRWQLVLEGNVVIRTRDGDTLKTEQLTMMGLTNNLSHKDEQRLQCDAGAKISRNDVEITANRLRYALEDHSVELLDGVRMVFKKGNVQSQRVYWALREDTVRVPDRSSGNLDGTPFSSDMLTLDVKNEKFTAQGCNFQLSAEPEDKPSTSLRPAERSAPAATRAPNGVRL